MPNPPQNQPPVISKYNKGNPPVVKPSAEQKLSSAMWVILATAAAFFDLGQIALDFIPVVGWILNLIIDVFVGLSLGTFLAIKGMLNWQTGLSIFLGFGVDFLTVGIAPAWIIDIILVWLLTDGANNLGKIPFLGEKMRKVAIMAIQKRGAGKPPQLAGEMAPSARPPVIPKSGAPSTGTLATAQTDSTGAKAKSSVTERADKLRSHIEEYGQSIGKSTRAGQSYIQNSLKQNRPAPLDLRNKVSSGQGPKLDGTFF